MNKQVSSFILSAWLAIFLQGCWATDNAGTKGVSNDKNGATVSRNIENDQLFYYPLCGFDYIAGKAAHLGCSSFDTFVYSVKTTRQLNTLALEAHLEGILDGYGKQSKHHEMSTLKRAIKDDKDPRSVVSKDQVSIDIEILEKNSIVTISSVVMSQSYLFVGQDCLSGKYDNNIEEIKDVISKIVDDYIVPSIFPDLIRK